MTYSTRKIGERLPKEMRTLKWPAFNINNISAAPKMPRPVAVFLSAQKIADGDRNQKTGMVIGTQNTDRSARLEAGNQSSPGTHKRETIEGGDFKNGDNPAVLCRIVVPGNVQRQWPDLVIPAVGNPMCSRAG